VIRNAKLIREFVPDRIRRFGARHAEVMNNPFWLYMMGYAGPAFGAYPLVFEKGIDDTSDARPIWCWKRFGQTRSVVNAGEYNERVIYIGGEHEDSYDDDFCIYNDVVVIDRDVGTTIYGYPREDFQPTDFHTATVVGAYIYIVGCLGYGQDRNADRTPVYRLDLDTMRIDRVQTYGEKPGWIWKHDAHYEEETNSIVVAGGKKLVSQEPFREETVATKFALDLNENYWSIRTW
jgi:hypothetical protein